MQVYFSHSYRDVVVNSYFLEHFLAEEIPLRADQKTDVWSVAKLERYMVETTGFVSVIPRRQTETDVGGYSQFIGHELNLARRARVPRLLFVDKIVFERHQLDFPEDAVLFYPEDLERDKDQHRRAIRQFSQTLEATYKLPQVRSRKGAALIVGEGPKLESAAEDVAEILRRERYEVVVLRGRRAERGLDDIRLLETLRRAELCAFLLGDRISDAHIALALAHADCIPSVRMQYDAKAVDSTPSVSGVIRWRDPAAMLTEFSTQLISFERGLVLPVEIARMSNPTAAAQALGTMKWNTSDENNWVLHDGPGLVEHVHPEHAFVRDEVARVRSDLRKALGNVRDRAGSRELCNFLYDGIRRHRFGYETDQRTGNRQVQSIRTSKQIAAHKTATCIDLACLFAGLLEAAGQDPLIVVIGGPNYAHALVGYRVRGEPAWEGASMGDLRAAVARGDALIFEATGVVEAEGPVGAESESDRRDKLLIFEDAVLAAETMLARQDVKILHLVDVSAIRSRNSKPT